MTPAVTFRGPLDARPESVGLSIELLAGAGGLHRRITSPYIQKTGLALAGFHEYLQAGRILLFGESEVRFLEDPGANAPRDALDPHQVGEARHETAAVLRLVDEIGVLVAARDRAMEVDAPGDALTALAAHLARVG